MAAPQKEQLIRLVGRNELASEIDGFLIDRQARGLSPRTVQFYSDELRYQRGFLEALGVRAMDEVTSAHLRQYLLYLSQSRNAGGIHAAYRAMRAFFRWYWLEYDIESINPITKVTPPRVPEKTRPLSLSMCLELCSMSAPARRLLAVGTGHPAGAAGHGVPCRRVCGSRHRGCRSDIWRGDRTRRQGRQVEDGLLRGQVSQGARAVSKAPPGYDPRCAFVGNERWYPPHLLGPRQIVRRRAEKAGVDTLSLHSF
jgi:hypothetical protein